MADKESWIRKQAIKAKHAERIKEEEAKYMAKIQEKWGESFLDEMDANTGKKGEFAEGVLKQLALLPIERARKKADESRRALSDELPEEKLREELTKITDTFNEEAAEMAATMRRYLVRLTQYKHHGKIDAEIIAKMKRGAVSIGKIVDALVLTHGADDKKPMGKLRTALMFSVGAIQLSGPNYTKAKEGIIHAIEKGNTEVKSFGWLAIALMDPEHKIKFAKEYAKKLNQDQKKEFIRQASTAGALNFMEIEEVLGKGRYEKLFDGDEGAKERVCHAALYKAQHDRSEEVKDLLKASCGAGTGFTSENLNFKNLILGLFVAGGTFSALFSTGLDIFKGGKFKSAEGIAGAIVNIDNGIKVATVYGAAKLMQNKDEKTHIQDEVDTPDAVAQAKQEIKTTVGGNPVWDSFFKSFGHKGATAFGDWSRYAFATYKGEALEKYLNISSFRNWMKGKAQYSQILAQFKEVKEGGKTKVRLKGGETPDNEVKKLAAAFRTLHIGSATAKTTYPDAIKVIA